MLASITQSIKRIKQSIFPNQHPKFVDEKEFNIYNADNTGINHNGSWYGIAFPTAHLDVNDKLVYRSVDRKKVMKGRVVRHVSEGILVAIPGGEVGIVLHKELDWSPKRGRKYFPVGSEHNVMVLSRPGNSRLFLSIRETNFPAYFNESLKEFPIGMSLICKIEAIRDYGLFVRVKENIDVFFHKNVLENFNFFKLNDLVEIKITGYDFEHNRILAEML